MDYNCLVGFEVEYAKNYLINNGINDFEIIYCLDRKQLQFDKEIVTAVRVVNNKLQLVVCRYLFSIQ